jgi:glycerol-3-phosphate acyltransferase PlsX
LNFIGNIEGRDVFKGTCDVVVTDGFTGNVVLKTAESVASLVSHKIREELRRDLLARLGAVLMLPALKRMRAQIDWEEYGAAPLLGVDGVCFVGHGSSRARAIRSAIRTLAKFVENRVNEHIREEIQSDHVTAA